MERPVKERLVGAAVLMAAAIILIPEMLSGPSHDAAEKQAERSEAQNGVKTYTIDLNKSPGVATSTPTPSDNRAPPPEETPPAATTAQASAPQASPEFGPAPTPPVDMPPAEEVVARPTASARPAPEAARVETQPKPTVKPAEAPKPTSQAARTDTVKPESAPKPVASASNAPTSAPPAAIPAGKGWAVQLGSYSSEATAEKLATEWRGKGQSAFVMPVKSGEKTLYRVRFGPNKDRAAAEAALKVVKPSIPAAAVVAHP